MNRPNAPRLVTDAPIRAFHALFATGFAAAWLIGDADRWRALHVALGYGLAGLLGWRLAYGLFGPRTARLGATLRRAAGLGPWLQALPAQLRAGSTARAGFWTQGQNLLMAGLPLLLMAGLPLLVLSGLATYQDGAGLGDAFEELHELLANALGVIALAHPALVLLSNLRRGRNLASAMWSGRVAGPGPDLVRQERRVGAWLLTAAMLLGTGLLWRAELRHPAADPARQSHSEAGHHEDDD